MRPKVLFVDDDPNVTRALRRLLHREPYDVRTAGSADEALGVLRSEPVDVVVSDEQMPGGRGSDLLSQVRREFPEVIRILLSGHIDLQTALKAVNEGEVYRMLSKPCSDLELVQTLRQVIELRTILSENQRLRGLVARQYEFMERLARENPSVLKVQRNDRGEVVIEGEPEDFETLVRELGREASRKDAAS